MNSDGLLLRKDLRGALNIVQWPAHVSLVTLRDDLLLAVHALLRQGYADASGSLEPFAIWCQRWRGDAEYDPQLCFIAMRDGGVVGVAHGWTSAYLKDLVVHARYQGQGIGRALLAQVFDAYKQRGEPWVDLRVMQGNVRARRMYERAGMVQVQRVEL